MHEGAAHDTVIGIETQRLYQPVGIEISDTHAKAFFTQLPAEFR